MISFLSRLLIVSLLALAGCSSGETLVPVSGVVTLDGKPIENAAVMFLIESGGRPATGITDAAGRYRLSTYEDNDGCLIGKHEVTVTLNHTDSQGTNTPQGAVSGSGYKITWLVPEKYSRPETSGLSAKVGRETGRFDFELASEE